MNYKKLLINTFILSVVIFSFSANAQTKKAEEFSYNPNATIDTSKKSIKSKAFTLINGDSIVINYHSPGVRNRVIWGGLVPMGDVWVTGAHDATNIEFPTNVIINGVTIVKGKYSIFTIPSRDEWIFIINKNWKQHLAWDYDVKDDVVRIKIKPEETTSLTERLQYFVDVNNNKGIIAMAWERIKISIPFQIK